MSLSFLLHNEKYKSNKITYRISLIFNFSKNLAKKLSTNLIKFGSWGVKFNYENEI